MQNVVPLATQLAARSADRASAPRREQYADEVARLIDAGVRLMARDDSIDLRVGDVVREAGLSNQAFYRHFIGKDEFLLAALDDGTTRLLAHLEQRMDRVDGAAGKVREWVSGVLAQARQPAAAASTRPFIVHAARLTHLFPDHAVRSRALLQAPLVAALDEGRRSGELTSADPARDAELVFHLTMGRMNSWLLERVTPRRPDVAHHVQFVLHALDATEV